MKIKPDSRLLGLLRHGKAEDSASSDAERMLTRRGQQQAQSVAEKIVRWIDTQGIDHERIVICHSPYQRAVETAIPLISLLGSATVKTLTYILPESPPRQVLSRLQDLADASPRQHFIIVSHMPLLAGLCALFESGDLHEARGLETAECRMLEGRLLIESGMHRLITFHPD